MDAERTAERTVTLTELDGCFGEIVRLVERYGSAVVALDSQPRYLVMKLDQSGKTAALPDVPAVPVPVPAGVPDGAAVSAVPDVSAFSVPVSAGVPDASAFSAVPGVSAFSAVSDVPVHISADVPDDASVSDEEVLTVSRRLMRRNRAVYQELAK